MNLTDVLFSRAQQHILGLLYSQPNSDFYTNEIIRSAQMGTGAVQRELSKLVQAGLLTVKQIGNQKHYQANHSMPFFSELRSIVLKTFGLADIIKNALVPLEYQINFAFIYGSIAKQTDTAQSDIDLMIITDELSYVDLFRLLDKAELQLKRKINPTLMSKLDWKQKLHQNKNFITQLENQPKIFLIGSENDFVELR